MPFVNNSTGRLRIIDEGTFSTDMVASIGSAIDVPVVGSLLPPAPQEMLDPNTMQQRIDERDELVLGTKGPVSLGVTTRMASHNTPLVGNVTPPAASAWWLRLLMLASWGGVRAETAEAGATTVQAGTTATVVNVTASHGDRFVPGSALGVVINGILYMAPVKSVAADAVTLKHALPSVPSNGSTVYGAVTFYPTESPSTSLNAFYEGLEPTDRWQYRGMVANGFGMNLVPRQLADFTWNLIGPGWTKLGSSTLAKGAVANFGPAALKDSSMVVTTVGSTTRTITSYNSLSLAHAFEMEALPGPDGYENVIDYSRVRSDESIITGQVTDYYSASGPALRDWFTHHQSRDDLAFFISAGSVPGFAFLIELPTLQVSVAPQRAPAGKTAGANFGFRCRNDADLGDSSELTRAPVRIHAF